LQDAPGLGKKIHLWQFGVPGPIGALFLKAVFPVGAPRCRPKSPLTFEDPSESPPERFWRVRLNNRRISPGAERGDFSRVDRQISSKKSASRLPTILGSAGRIFWLLVEDPTFRVMVADPFDAGKTKDLPTSTNAASGNLVLSTVAARVPPRQSLWWPRPVSEPICPS